MVSWFFQGGYPPTFGTSSLHYPPLLLCVKAFPLMNSLLLRAVDWGEPWCHSFAAGRWGGVNRGLVWFKCGGVWVCCVCCFRVWRVWLRDCLSRDVKCKICMRGSVVSTFFKKFPHMVALLPWVGYNSSISSRLGGYYVSW